MYRRKRRGAAKGLKAQVRKIAKKVSRIAKVRELKEFYTSVSAMSPAGAGGSGFQIQHIINDIIEGDDYNQRTGRKIAPQGLEVRMNIMGTEQAAGLTVKPRIARVILFQDMGYNGTALTGPQLLQTYSTTVDEIKTATSPINTDYVRSKNVPDGRAHILYDRSFWVHPVFSGYANECTKKLNIRIPRKKLKECYYNGVGSGTSVGGTICMYVCLGQAAAALDNSSFSYIAKLTYFDD